MDVQAGRQRTDERSWYHRLHTASGERTAVLLRAAAEGLVPTDGTVPLSPTLDTACALTRSVRDAVLIHEILAARKVAKDAKLRLHVHDTRNTGLANAYAGIEAGIDILDASVGGIGGCPFAPGATGNLATEDLVYALHRGGFETGYDLNALIDTARWIGQHLNRPVPSALTRAGNWPTSN